MSQERLKLLIGRAETAAAKMADREVEELRRLIETCPRGLRVVRLMRSRTLQVSAPDSLRRRLEVVEERRVDVVSTQLVGQKVPIAGN